MSRGKYKLSWKMRMETDSSARQEMTAQRKNAFFRSPMIRRAMM